MKRSEHDVAARNARARNRRRRYIINAAVQWKYACTFTLVVFLFTCILSCILFGVLHHQARMRYIHPEVYTARVGAMIVFFSVIFSAITAGGVGLWGLISTHRLCGPLFVLDRYLGELAKGRFPRPRPLRRKDEFKDLHRTFANAMDALRDSKQAELTLLNEALDKAKAVMDGGGESRDAALQGLVRRIEKLRDGAVRALGQESDNAPVAQPTRCRPDVVQTPASVA